MAQPTRRQQQRDTTAQRIYEVAIQLFATQGYDATTVEAIAQAAGVAKGTFFVHFATKEAILGHLGLLQMQRVQAAVASEPQFASYPVRTQIQFIFRTLAAGVETQPELTRKFTLVLLRREFAFNNTLLSFDLLDDLVTPLVDAAQVRGELRADADARELAVLLRGIYFVALSEWVQQPETALAPRAERAIDFLLQGLRQGDR